MADPTQGSPEPRANNRPAHALREIESRDLLLGEREILIRHSGEVYRLSLTRSGKLILRK